MRYKIVKFFRSFVIFAVGIILTGAIAIFFRNSSDNANTASSNKAPSYSISKYQGDLTLNSDNTATYVMRLTYQFKSSYNGHREFSLFGFC
jgi:hypothetical protein